MKIEIIKGSENYTAKVFKITEYKKHPNADKLWMVTVDYNTIITGVEPVIGSLYVYFPVLSIIDGEFIKHINGFSDSTLNSDTTVKGFFGSKPRVKPIKLRGEKSEGYIHPVQAIEEFYSVSLKEGQEFNSINGAEVCKKYVIKTIKSNINSPKKPKQSRVIDGQFHFHNDTSNFRKNVDKIEPTDLIEISYKKHGTSLIVGNVLVKKSLSAMEKFLKWCGVDVIESEYDVLYSSRKVLKNDALEKEHSHYYKSDIWGLAADRIKDIIPKGYTLYCEIVGQTPTGEWIQKNYDYGASLNDFKVYVYKITNTNSDGFVINLSTPQIKEFCDKYNLNFSDTLLYYGHAKNVFPELEVSTHWHEEFLKKLEEKYVYDGNCHMCSNKVPREGIVIVKQNMFEYEAYKLKTFQFLNMESKEQDEEVVNIEDNQE